MRPVFKVRASFWGLTITTSSRRAIIYVDGFNLFYGSVKGTPYAWLDIAQLFKRLRGHDDIQAIYYFTARVPGKKQRKRQEEYLKALDTLSLVTVVEGHFKNKTVKCRFPGGTFRRNAPLLVHTVPEEKETDVNIAVQMICDAHADNMDIAVLVSGDSDLIPVIKRIQSEFPRIKVIIYIPSPRKGVFIKSAHELKSLTDTRMLPKHLLGLSQLPDTIYAYAVPFRT